MREPELAHSTPRWVRTAGIIAIVLLLLVGLHLFGMSFMSTGHGDHGSPPVATEHGPQRP